MLGLEPDYDYTPRMDRRIVFAAAQGASFQDASAALEEIGELRLLPKRVWRAAKRIGDRKNWAFRLPKKAARHGRSWPRRSAT